MEAFTILQEKTIDILFLDIHMPRLTGIDLLKTLKNKPKVIITSATGNMHLKVSIWM